MRHSSLLETVQTYVSRLPFWRAKKSSPVRKISARSGPLSREKQAQLEILCRKLFEKRELITSGRLQLLGLGKVKQRMGKRWAGMQNIIYEICDDTLRKYTSPGDIYMRYSDESYMLLFGTASAKEGELKTALIAEEIKRRLFDEEGIEDIDVLDQTTQIKAHSISKDIPFPDSVQKAFDQSYVPQRQKAPPRQEKSAPPALPVIEVDAFSESLQKIISLDLGVEIAEIPFRDVHYVPVWDQSKGRMIAHLCLAKGASIESPMDVHRAYYERVKSAEMADMDLAVLARIIGWMKDNPEKLAGFGIICPVHYETLVGVEGKGRYRALCQKVDERMKLYLLFMVLDLPPAVPWFSLSQVVSPLKTYGRILCGQVASSGAADFESMRLAGFDNVGIILSSSKADRRVDINAFVNRAKRHLITKTFVLGIDDQRMATEVAAAGVHYLGGQAIHSPVIDPVAKPAFEEFPFGRMWAQTASNT